MAGDKLMLVNWIEQGDDIVIKQMRTVPYGFSESSKETTKVFVAYDKVLEIIDEESTRNGMNLKQTAEIRRRVVELKGGDAE